MWKALGGRENWGNCGKMLKKNTERQIWWQSMCRVTMKRRMESNKVVCITWVNPRRDWFNEIKSDNHVALVVVILVTSGNVVLYRLLISTIVRQLPILPFVCKRNVRMRPVVVLLSSLTNFHLSSKNPSHSICKCRHSSSSHGRLNISSLFYSKYWIRLTCLLKQNPFAYVFVFVNCCVTWWVQHIADSI